MTRTFKKWISFVSALTLPVSSFATPYPVSELVHSGINDGFYTYNLTERGLAISYGFRETAIPFSVESRQTPGTAPLFRFYRGLPATDHFYTIDFRDASIARSYGYAEEPAAGYIFLSPRNGTVPLYRMSWFNPANGDVAHRFVTDRPAVQGLVSAGWGFDKIEGYV